MITEQCIDDQIKGSQTIHGHKKQQHFWNKAFIFSNFAFICFYFFIDKSAHTKLLRYLKLKNYESALILFFIITANYEVISTNDGNEYTANGALITRIHSKKIDVILKIINTLFK